jgi:hypothetical protein
MKNRYTLFVIMVSISVAVLIHFPELVSLLDILEGATLFPEMEPIDVASEVLFTFISLIILFEVNTLLFHFNQSAVKIGYFCRVYHPYRILPFIDADRYRGQIFHSDG